MKELRTRLGKRQLTPSNAIPGFWILPFGDHTSGIPAAGSAPTGCILPDNSCKRPTTTFRALDMYPLDTQWYIMSEFGLYTYRHSSELAHQRLVLFVPADEWPNAYQVTMLEPLPHKDIGKFFGKEASAVAPVSTDAVCLMLTRYDGSVNLKQ